jgi:starch phosphorylase
MPSPPYRPLPESLESLTELALDLRLNASPSVERLWNAIDSEAWQRVKNPLMILQNARRESLEAAAADASLQAALAERIERRSRYLQSEGWFRKAHRDSELTGVAYFSMEFGLSEALPIYSGGLGILAGDHMKSASDLNVPIYGVGLLYQQGYFRQVLAEDGWQLQAFPYNDPGTLPITPVLDDDQRWPRVRLELPGRTLFLRVWKAQVGRVNLYLLDSNHPLNNPWDRGITANLYAAGKEKRLLQEIVLGVGGWRLLEKLGIEVEVCHLNEGHAAFAVLARAASFSAKYNVPFHVALRATRAGNVFTTHTPVEAAFDQFDANLLKKYADPFIREAGTSLETVLAMGRRNPEDSKEPFNMAYLAMRGCCHVNGVAKLHGEVSRRLFRGLFPSCPEDEVPIGYVTNGVHVGSWDSPPANDLWSQNYRGEGRWTEDLRIGAEGISQCSDEELWDFRAKQRVMLVHYVRDRFEYQLRQHNASEDRAQRARHVLDPNCLTLGFARRFTAYKRPNLLLHDAERFARLLCDSDRPAQIIIAGKAHPNDDHGKGMVREMATFANRDDLFDRVVFLEDYDITLARHFAAGVDVWINSPRRPAEACGTSGMKMIANGGLHFSTLDGWWDEAYTPEVGFRIGDGLAHHGELDAQEAEQMYNVLENEIAREFYDRDPESIPREWIARVRASMTQLTPTFSSDRMVREYVETAYIPAAKSYKRRSAENGKLAAELENWHSQIIEDWHGLRFGEVHAEPSDEGWRFAVHVFLGDLCPDCIRIELYSEPEHGQTAPPIVLQHDGPIHGAVNAFKYIGIAPDGRPANHYTPRIRPFHPDAFVPLESTQVYWNA